MLAALENGVKGGKWFSFPGAVRNPFLTALPPWGKDRALRDTFRVSEVQATLESYVNQLA
jgi:hypothetical protein